MKFSAVGTLPVVLQQVVWLQRKRNERQGSCILISVLIIRVDQRVCVGIRIPCAASVNIKIVRQEKKEKNTVSNMCA